MSRRKPIKPNRYMDLFDALPVDCFDLMAWLVEHDLWDPVRYLPMERICDYGARIWYARKLPLRTVEYRKVQR